MTSYKTFKALKKQANSKLVYWLEISGLKYAFTDGNITADNIATLFGDIYTPELTVIPNLMKPNISYGRSIELLTGKGSTGGFSIELLDIATEDHPDGFMTWLFGSDNADIIETTLREPTANELLTASGFDESGVQKHGGGAGHNWYLEDTTNFAASGYAYCDLETIYYHGDSEPEMQFIEVDRGQFLSPVASHKRKVNYNYYPRVTSHPTVFPGRIVTLYCTYMDEAGNLASSLENTNVGCRMAAYPIRGVFSEKSMSSETQCWRIDCLGLDTLLRRPMNKKPAQLHHNGRATRVVSSDEFEDWAADNNGTNWHTENNVKVLTIFLEDIDGDGNTGPETHYVVEVAPGTYSRETFIAVVNDAIQDRITNGFDIDGVRSFPGGLELTCYADDNGLTFVVQEPTENEATYPFRVKMAFGNARLMGFNQFGQTNYFDNLGYDVELLREYTISSDRPHLGNVYTQTFAYEAPTLNLVMYSNGAFRTERRANDGLVSDFAVDDFVTIESGAGKTVCQITEIIGDELFIRRLEHPEALGFLGVKHTGDIVLRKCLILKSGDIAGRIAWHAHPILEALLSTGIAGFNHRRYDRLDEGMGIEIPHMTPWAGVSSQDSLIDVGAFERLFQDLEPFINYYFDVIDEPTEVLEWLSKRLAVFGAYLVIKKGQISCNRGHFVLQQNGVDIPEYTVNRSGLIPGYSITTNALVDQITWKTNYNQELDDFALITNEGFGAPESDARDTRVIELEDKGLYTSIDRLSALALDVYSEFEKETWSYELTTDRMHTDIEPGDIVNVTDDAVTAGAGMPNTSGSRGMDGQRMVVLSTTTDHGTQTNSWTLLQSRKKRGGFAPAGMIASWQATGSNETQITTENFFSMTDTFILKGGEYNINPNIYNYYTTQDVEDILSKNTATGSLIDFYDNEETNVLARDVDNFIVGDTVRIDLLGAGANSITDEHVGHIITAVSGNTLTFSPALNTGSYTAGVSPLVITYDRISSSNQATTTQSKWAHIGSGSLIRSLPNIRGFKY